jgi:hypothetical protein
MKITKRQLKQIIKEELLKEYGGTVANFGGVAGALGATGRPESPPMKDEPDSIVQEKAAQFFTNLEITEKVVGILVNNIAIPDLITIMEKVPKIDTAEEELHEILDASADAGDYVKDFKDSDAPQFRGKSKEKRKEMAIAAHASAKEKKGKANNG